MEESKSTKTMYIFLVRYHIFCNLPSVQLILYTSAFFLIFLSTAWWWSVRTTVCTYSLLLHNKCRPIVVFVIYYCHALFFTMNLLDWHTELYILVTHNFKQPQNIFCTVIIVYKLTLMDRKNWIKIFSLPSGSKRGWFFTLVSSIAQHFQMMKPTADVVYQNVRFKHFHCNLCWNSRTIIASNLRLKSEKRKGPTVYNSMVITGYKIALRKQNTAKTMWKISTSNTSSFHTKTAKKVNNHNEFRGNSYTVIINNYTNTHYIELLCRN